MQQQLSSRQRILLRIIVVVIVILLLAVLGLPAARSPLTLGLTQVEIEAATPRKGIVQPIETDCRDNYRTTDPVDFGFLLVSRWIRFLRSPCSGVPKKKTQADASWKVKRRSPESGSCNGIFPGERECADIL